jgi:hypothetical protein
MGRLFRWPVSKRCQSAAGFLIKEFTLRQIALREMRLAALPVRHIAMDIPRYVPVAVQDWHSRLRSLDIDRADLECADRLLSRSDMAAAT